MKKYFSNANMLKNSTQGAGEYRKHAAVQKVGGTVRTSLTALSTYLSQIWNHHPPNGEEEKKLSQRIIKIWVFWDATLSHWVSDAYFNGRLKIN